MKSHQTITILGYVMLICLLQEKDFEQATVFTATFKQQINFNHKFDEIRVPLLTSCIWYFFKCAFVSTRA